MVDGAEPPETPAPVFAVRAFKHAIFGTPQTVQQPKPRRHSNTADGPPRPTEQHADSRALRPRITRPKSTGDAQTLLRSAGPATFDLPCSPTKGILLTPGTAAVKRKNVTFGEHVVDNDDKRPSKSGLPDEYPGKFPSPWVPSSLEVDGSMEKKGGRGKLSEALEQARDEAARQKLKSGRGNKTFGDGHDMQPQALSGVGKDWKQEYDIYRENTQREIKKLIAKRKHAKDFARAKDEECTALADRLKQEQKRADRLETRTAELSAQVRELEKLLCTAQETAKNHESEVVKLKHLFERKDSSRPQTSDGARPSSSRSEKDDLIRKDSFHAVEGDATSNKVRAERRQMGPRSQRDVVPGHVEQQAQETTSKAASDLTGTGNGDEGRHKTRGHSKPELQPHRQSSDEIWANVPSSSSPDDTRTPDAHRAPQQDRLRRNNGDPQPLQTISANAIAAGPREKRRDADELAITSDTMRQIRNDGLQPYSPETEDAWIDAPLLAPSISDLPPLARPELKHGSRPRSPQTKALSGEQIQAPSSPFDYFTHAKKQSGTIAPSRTVGAFGQSNMEGALQDETTPAASAPAQEPAGTLKPSAVWSSISGNAEKRTSGLIGKDGREVGADRLEAARARIAARGRVVS